MTDRYPSPRRRGAWITPTLALAAAACLGIGAMALPAAAQDKSQDKGKTATWPTGPVRLILPFGAGSATDVSARLIADRLSSQWKQPVLVDNRPGGDGLIAISAFVNAKDDHVMLFASSATFLAHPYTQKTVPYDLKRDFAPVAQVSHTVLTASASAKSGIQSLNDLVKRAKETPDKVNVAGAAGLPEFAVDAFIKSQGLKATKVPYRDVVQAGRDLGADHIQFLLSSFAVVRPLMESGQIKVLALGGRERSKLLPEVPSVVEAGHPELVVETTAGLYGQKDMPIELRQRIAKEVMDALADEKIGSRIFQSGQDVAPGGPEVLKETIERQEKAAASVAKTLDMKRLH